jgi:hypothetical protein
MIQRPWYKDTFLGTAKVGIHGGGSPCEAARFLRITRCTGVPTPSLIVGGDLGLVPVVSLFCVIAAAWTSPPIIDQAQNL